MIACISPSSNNVTETTNTLRYASRAKKITSKPVIKMDPRELLIINLKKEVKVLRSENHYLRQQLEFPAKPRGQLQKENDKKFLDFMKDQDKNEKIAEGQMDTGLYEMLQEYMVENETLRSENMDLHNTRERIRREQQLLYRENEKLVKRLESGNGMRSLTHSGSWQQVSRHGSLHSPSYVSIESSPALTPVFPDMRDIQSKQKITDVPPPNNIINPPIRQSAPQYPRQPPPGARRPPHRIPEPVTRPTALPVQPVNKIHTNQPPLQQQQQQLQQQQHLPPQPRPTQNQIPRPPKPSFQTQKGNKNVVAKVDNTHQMTRTENKNEVSSINDQLTRELAALDSEIQQQQAFNRSQHMTTHNT